MLECRLEVVVQDADHRFSDQRNRRPTAGKHHTGGIDHVDVQLTIDIGPLSTELGQGGVALGFEFGNSFYQQGVGTLGVGIIGIH
ncbi:hypothetical protein D3C84_1155940 [compost metagenome]